MVHGELRRELRSAFRIHGRRVRDLGFWAVACHRCGRRVADSEHTVVRVLGSRAYGLAALALDVAAGLQGHREATIGEDLHLVHGWNIKIHPDAILGARVGIMHDVTIGTTPDLDGVPVIGDDVFIGAGARILGPVTIGAGARVGANSVVITDVPRGATAVGVPARVLRYTGRAVEAAAVAAAAVAVAASEGASERAAAAAR